MSTLTPARIAGYAHQAGFRGQALITAVAVALAESGGNRFAHNTVPPDNSYGLWQINMLGALGPARRRALRLGTDRKLFDPAANARAAFMISSQGASFPPWSTYTNGRYRQFLAAAGRGVRAAGRAGYPTGGPHPQHQPSAGHHPGHRPAGGTGSGSSPGVVLLDLAELAGLATLFQHSADRVSHTRRALRELAADLGPARTRLADQSTGQLLAAVLGTLDGPTRLAQLTDRLDRQGQYAAEVRRLAERADRDGDGRWGRAEALGFVGRLGARVDPFERAVLEALIGGRITAGTAHRHSPTAGSPGSDHHRTGSSGSDHHAGSPGSDHHAGGRSDALPPAGVSGLTNGRVPPSRLTPVGDGERMTTVAGARFRQLDAAARAAGLDLRVNSGYRDYQEQAALYAAYRAGRGALAAAPGHSTHGLGLSADIAVTDPATLAWLRRHAAHYGFVNDVPSEPWHWTYRP